MTLPAGDYTITPTVNVTAVNVGDTDSSTTFKPVDITPRLECNEHREIKIGTPAPCDIDGNGIVDRLDINAIFKNRGKRASGSSDPMDVNNDGMISINDARICTLRCKNLACAP